MLLLLYGYLTSHIIEGLLKSWISQQHSPSQELPSLYFSALRLFFFRKKVSASNKQLNRGPTQFSLEGIPQLDTNQDQKSSEGSFAIQSGHDTIVQTGLSAKDMQLILDAIGSNIRQQLTFSKETVDARLNDFETRLTERFTQLESSHIEAFRDPDFRYVVGRAQMEYARSGDEEICKSLIDLIARRSMETSRTRLSLTLNDAVEKAAFMTKNEFAELSICFIVRYTQRMVENLAGFAGHLNATVIPFLDDISLENSSYLYLESHSCIRIDIGSLDLRKAFINGYGGLFSKGFERDRLEAHLEQDQKNNLDSILMPCLNDENKLQFNALNKSEFLKKTTEFGLSNDTLDKVWKMFEGTFWAKVEIIERLSPAVPRIADIFRVWEETPLKNLSLTSVGIALGYANVARRGLPAELSIWIK